MKLYKDEPTECDFANTLKTLQVLKYYHFLGVTPATERKWLQDYINMNGLSLDLSGVPDCHIRSPFPALARLSTNGVSLLEKHLDSLHSYLKDISTKKVEVERSERISPSEVVKQTAVTIIPKIYEIIQNGDCFKYLKVNQIGPRYTKKLMEYIEVKSPDNKKSLLVECQKWIDSTKKPRKERKKKEKTANDIIKYLRVVPEWNGFKSGNLERLIGSKCIITYHTRKGIMGVYYAEGGLKIHRCAIKGYEEAFNVRVSRKEVLTTANKCSSMVSLKRFMNSDLKGLERTKTSERITESMIILGVF
jgi:hypothetical protein